VIPRHSPIVTTKHEITRDKTSNAKGVFLASFKEFNEFKTENLVHRPGQNAINFRVKIGTFVQVSVIVFLIPDT
jgi:hypothetical protein